MTAEEILRLHDTLQPPAPAPNTPEALLQHHDQPPASAVAAPPWYARVANAIHGAMPAVPARTYPLTPPSGDGPDPDLPLEESLNPADLALTGGMANIGTKVARDVASRYMLSRAATNVLRPVAAGLGAEVGYKASQATGMAPGQVNDYGWPDVLNLAIPGTLDALKATGRGLLSVTRAGRALTVAETETAARQAAYEQLVREHEGATLDAFDTATQKHTARLTDADAAQVERQTARDTRLAQAEQEHAQQAQREAAAHQTAQADATATYTRQLDEYGNAITAHQEARADAGRLVRGPQPAEAPSWYRYQQARDAAPTAPVDFAPVLQTARDVARAPRAEYLPTRVQERLTQLQAAGNTVDMNAAHEELRFWGPLTSSKNGDIRATAKQVYGTLQDTMEQGAREMPDTANAVGRLRDARAAFRKEKAMEDVQRIVQSRPAGSTGDDMVFRLHPGNIVSRLEEKAASDPLFRGSFAPGEFEALVDEFRGMGGLPRVPTTPPVLADVGPAPVTTVPRQLERYRAQPLAPVPRRLQTLRDTPASEVPLVGVPGRPALPVAAQPEPAPSLKSMGLHLLSELGGGGGLSYLLGGSKIPAVVGGTVAAVDTMDALVSKALLTPRGRQVLRSVMADDGSVALPVLQSALAGGRAATGP